MTKKISRPTKHLGTSTGVAAPRLVHDAAHDAGVAYHDSYENALDIFPEEHPAAPPGAAGVPAPLAPLSPPAPPRAAARPRDERRFVQVDDESEIETYRSPYYDEPEKRSWSERSRDLAPVAAAALMFVGVIAGVVAWVMNDIRDASIVQNFRPTESAVPPRPIQPRPPSWSSTVNLDSNRETSAVPSPAPAAERPAPVSLERPAPTPSERPAPASIERPAPPPSEVRANTKRATGPPIQKTVTTPPPTTNLTVPPRAGAAMPSPAPPAPQPANLAPVIVATPASEQPPATADRNAAPSIADPPAPTPRAPVTAAAAAAATAPIVRRDEDDVRSVLTRYQSAYSDLDAYAAREIWPTVDIKALSRAFDQLDSQTVEFKQCRISVNDAKAVANCDGSALYVPKVGGKGGKTESRRWRFDLRKGNEGWTIESVSSR